MRAEVRSPKRTLRIVEIPSDILARLDQARLDLARQECIDAT